MPSRKEYPLGYGPLEPVADYRPWELDTPFLESARQVEANTKVDIYRLWELWHLVGQTRELPGDILEIGVWRGGSAGLMGRALATFNLKRHIWLADTFTGVVKAGPKDDYYKGGEHADTSVETVTALFGSLGIEDYTILEGIFPEQTAHLLVGDAIALCHVDVDVYQSARDAAEWVWPRMPAGGVIVYDDYGFYGCEGVTAFVNEEAHRDGRLVLHNLNGHAVVVKTER